MALTGVTNAHGPSPSQQHAGLHRAVWQLQQEVIRPNARFKPTLPKKSRVPIIYRIKQQYYFSGILVFCKTNWPYFEPVNKQGTYETIETISLEKQGRFKLMPREWYDGDKSLQVLLKKMAKAEPQQPPPLPSQQPSTLPGNTILLSHKQILDYRNCAVLKLDTRIRCSRTIVVLLYYLTYFNWTFKATYQTLIDRVLVNLNS